MGKKIPVLVMVDPDEEVTIRPLAAEISTRRKEVGGLDYTSTASFTYPNDQDMDFD